MDEKEMLQPEMQAAMLMQQQSVGRIGKEEIQKAAAILQKYKKEKQNLEQRVVDDELWWQLRHWEVMRRNHKDIEPQPEPSSAWLFNAIINKHADAMDNYPEPVVLPRERDDEQSAKVLSAVLPVVMEYNDFESVYAENWDEKLKHGCAVYGVFWDATKENGLGDVDIRRIDLLNIFWEPGIENIQKSKNLFILELQDTEDLEEQYPQYKGKLGTGSITVKEYVHDDTVDTTGKSVVVDWYYKVRTADGRTVLHYAKFCNDCLLYSSENTGEYPDGWYDDGEYPVVFDSLFREKGSPAGFGYVTICRDPQAFIDRLSANIQENAMMSSKVRYFASRSLNVNMEQFKNWNESIVEVDGEISPERLREINVQPPNGAVLNVLNMKIDEMKETAANRDVNSGGSGGGLTAASAIAALQEAGNKVSRDMIGASYRIARQIYTMVINRMRQYYDLPRTFRIMGNDAGLMEYVEMSNAQLGAQEIGTMTDGTPIYRTPVFDLKIKAQRKNPFSRMEQNATAKELYGMGFFNPDRAQEAEGALEMMDFEGIEKVRERVQQGQTLVNMLNQMQQQMQMMQQQMQMMMGGMPTAPMMPQGGAPAAPDAPAKDAAPMGARTGGDKLADSVMASRQPQGSYTQKILNRTKADPDATPEGTAVK